MLQRLVAHIAHNRFTTQNKAKDSAFGSEMDQRNNYRERISQNVFTCNVISVSACFIICYYLSCRLPLYSTNKNYTLEEKAGMFHASSSNSCHIQSKDFSSIGSLSNVLNCIKPSMVSPQGQENKKTFLLFNQVHINVQLGNQQQCAAINVLTASICVVSSRQSLRNFGAWESFTVEASKPVIATLATMYHIFAEAGIRNETGVTRLCSTWQRKTVIATVM